MWATEGNHPIRVLYVDDNHDIADTAVIILETIGFVVRAAYDGFSALSVATVFEPDVCVLDLNMPGMDGDELAVRLRQQFGDRRLILVAVTAQCHEEGRTRIKTAGFDHMLIKPADLFELARLLRPATPHPRPPTPSSTRAFVDVYSA